MGDTHTQKKQPCAAWNLFVHLKTFKQVKQELLFILRWGFQVHCLLLERLIDAQKTIIFLCPPRWSNTAQWERLRAITGTRVEVCGRTASSETSQRTFHSSGFLILSHSTASRLVFQVPQIALKPPRPWYLCFPLCTKNTQPLQRKKTKRLCGSKSTFLLLC